jgi:hypothetical protein
LDGLLRYDLDHIEGASKEHPKVDASAIRLARPTRAAVMADAKAERLDLVGAYRLPSSLGVTVGCLSKSFSVEIGGLPGSARTPGWSWDGDRPVVVAPDFDSRISHAFAHRIEQERDPWIRWNYWGSVSSWNAEKRTLGGVHLGALLIEFPVLAADVTYSETLHGRGQAQGPTIDALYTSIDLWFDLVRAWIETAVDQDADPENPLRGVITPGSGLMVSINDAEVVSTPTAANRGIVFSREQEAVNLPRLRKVIKQANAGTTPSDAHLLLRDGRAALRRGGYRRAVIDAGGAVELTLATFNQTTTQVNTGGRATLGWYVDQPTIAARANLPANLKQDLVVLRNNAIHQNHIPSRSETLEALRLAKEVVDGLDPLPV